MEKNFGFQKKLTKSIVDAAELRSARYIIWDVTISRHAAVRLAQRSIKMKDAELIVLIGTQVDDGYYVLTKDFQEVERQLKNMLDQFRRVVGKRLVVANGQIITAYYLSKTCHRRLLRNAQESKLYD